MSIRMSEGPMAPSGERVQVYRQVREIVQGSRGQEIVDERQRRLKAARERRVVGGPGERVQPQQAMAASLEPRDLIPQLPGIAAIPPVGDEQDHGPPAQNTPAPSLVEFSDGAPD